MSGLIRPQPGEGNPAELGFVAALALHDVVGTLVDRARLELKWPNDLNLDGAKLSGILLEREADVLVLGIGVNVAQAPALADRATIALGDVGVATEVGDLAQAVAQAFAARRAVWQAGGFAPIREAWLARAHPLGTRLWVTRGEGRIAGNFAGLGADGALLLDGVDGARHVIHAGDVWGTDNRAPQSEEGQG
jgi:BirA family transcriptional regulator, biotin operon repressor / biotin---[acetyl-CoA-carboxylase] ligase